MQVNDPKGESLVTKPREALSPEEQRIAIATACGWTGFNPDNIPDCLQYEARAPSGKWGSIPDYLNDLNAMHEAVRTLDSHQLEIFHRRLTSDVIGWGSYNKGWVVYQATAAQWAEAFLKALGLW